MARVPVGCSELYASVDCLLDIKYPSSSLFNNYFVDCRLLCIVFIVSVFIDPETFPWVCYKIVSGPYTNFTYKFSSHAGLWKVVVRVPVFVISPVIINTLICFKSVTQDHCFWFQVNHLEVFLLSYVKFIFNSGRVIDL